jgi:MoxR-like ATPase
VASYIARLVGAAHPGNEYAVKTVTDFVSYGPSPRAAIAMAESARAAALLNGRTAVSFQDVQLVAPAVLNHRLLLNYNAKLAKKTAHDLVAELLKQVPCAEAGLPAGLAFEKE